MHTYVNIIIIIMILNYQSGWTESTSIDPTARATRPVPTERKPAMPSRPTATWSDANAAQRRTSAMERWRTLQLANGWRLRGIPSAY